MSSMGELLLKYKGNRASVNSKESQHCGWIVVDVEPDKNPDRSVFVIHEVAEEMLVLDYFDMKELSCIPLEKIIKVNVILRDK